MIPGNVDPRRPDKVQRYKPAVSGNGNAPGEDLTPDYMNILGPDSTTGNVQGDNKINEPINDVEAKPPQQQNIQVSEEASKSNPETVPANTMNASNVIPTSPQYGVAIIPTTTTTNDIPVEATTIATDTITESTAKTSEAENKDMHSTPSKNERFKVVKIASSEPFRRGRWKCMDYVDQTPPATTQQTKTTTQVSSGNVQLAGSNVYMQTQSLPPHQIQQLLLQSALSAAQPQFYQGTMQSQVVPQAQYFYPAVQGQGNVPPQQMITNPAVVSAASVQPQFINPAQQFFQPAVLPQNYPNVQFMQPAYQNQNSAFVPTTQNIQNYQQAQSYTGQAAVTQGQTPTIPATQPQPMVNGFAYSPQNITEQQVAANNLPTQVAKNVMLNSTPPVTVTQAVQNQVVQNQQESQPIAQNSIPQPQAVPIQQNQQHQHQQLPEQNQTTYQAPPPQQQQQQQQHHTQQVPQNINPVLQNMNPPMQNVVVLQQIDPNQNNDVYANPQFVASVHSIPIVEQNEMQMVPVEGSLEVSTGMTNGNSDDLAKTNPVVNAIDNKIEQAMDLVKSHLMYTVREEVEVLKEKIAELMERIQQLETENNFLRSQLPKNISTNNGTSEPSPQQ